MTPNLTSTDAGPIRLPVRALRDNTYVVDANSATIAHVHPANAAVIVTALNATAQHDKLVSALENMVGECPVCQGRGVYQMSNTLGYEWENNCDRCAEARAALVTAKDTG